MTKTWEERQVSLGGAIIAAVITLALGVIVGVNWNNFTTNFLPYLGVQSQNNVDWSELNEVYQNLALYYDGDLDTTELIEGAKKGLTDAVGDIYTNYMTEQLWMSTRVTR